VSFSGSSEIVSGLGRLSQLGVNGDTKSAANEAALFNRFEINSRADREHSRMPDDDRRCKRLRRPRLRRPPPHHNTPADVLGD
jgi:hypothetical protein